VTTTEDAPSSDARPVDAPRTDAPGADGGAIDTGGGSDAGSPDGGGALIPVIVAAGSNHGRWLSIDEGLTWCDVRETAPSTTDFDNPNLLRNITYANGRFVTGSWTAIFVSTNGYAWTDVTGDGAPAFGQWVAQIDYGNAWWVATGGYGTAMRSRDLMTWRTSRMRSRATRPRAPWPSATACSSPPRRRGWWSSSDGAAWTQLDAAAGTDVIFDGTDFVARPDFDRGRGIRLQSGWPDQIRRAEDVDGASYTTVATLEESPTHFAFGYAPAADYAAGVVPAPLATCLGL
jgi:hypothetical protein